MLKSVHSEILIQLHYITTVSNVLCCGWVGVTDGRQLSTTVL